MRKNVQFFGNPTLLSSRPKTDLMESGESTVQRPSIAANSGFAGNPPVNLVLKQILFPWCRWTDTSSRVIANLEPNDRVGYMSDAITGDQIFHVNIEKIRTALGGVDELSISAGVTATDTNHYLEEAATAKKKALLYIHMVYVVV